MSSPQEARPAPDLPGPSLNVLLIGEGALLLPLLLGPVLSGLSGPTLAVPLLASIILLGLPHGAVDHLAAARLSTRFSGWGGQAFFFLAYLGLMGLYFCFWWFFPALGFASFMLLTLLHWGQGDLWVIRWRGWIKLSPLSRLLAVILRGGAPILIPVLVFPGIVALVASWPISLFEVVDPRVLKEVLLQMRWPLGILYGAAFLLYAALGLRQVLSQVLSRAMWLEDMGELGLLILFFALIHPLFAIGVYFTLWHSLRHLDRLRWTVVKRGALSQGSRASWVGLLIKTMPLTIISLGLLVALAWAVREGSILQASGGVGLEQIVGIYLVLLSVLTLPHTLLVLMMDLKVPKVPAK